MEELVIALAVPLPVALSVEKCFHKGISRVSESLAEEGTISGRSVGEAHLAHLPIQVSPSVTLDLGMNLCTM